MHQYANKYVRISDISAYLICPRLAYFRRRREGRAPSPEVVRSAIFKELSRSLAGVLAADDPEALLRSNAEVACGDAEIVYGLDAGPVLEEVIGLAGDVIEGLLIESERVGRERLLALLDPWERAQVIYSDRLRISGSVDRVALVDGARCPVVVGASRPPANGVYAADRLKLAASAMLVEEKYGEPISRGAVEYTCGWRIRETDVRRGDRMALLSARNRVLQMGSAMPAAKRGSWCPACEHREACDVRPSLLGSLFRPMLANDIARSRMETNK